MVAVLAEAISKGGWGNSILTVCDLQEGFDLDQISHIKRDEEKIYAVVDGAHRLTAVLELQKLNPESDFWKKFKFTCSYVGNLQKKDCFAYAFGIFMFYFDSLQ